MTGGFVSFYKCCLTLSQLHRMKVAIVKAFQHPLSTLFELRQPKGNSSKKETVKEGVANLLQHSLCIFKFFLYCTSLVQPRPERPRVERDLRPQEAGVI